MRTLEEVKIRVEEHIADKSFFGGATMISACGGSHPLMFWHPDYLKEGVEPEPLTEEAVVEEMGNYIDFAFGKAYGERGLSSQRSIWKFKQWLWLIEDNELLSFAEDDTNYPMYGLPILKVIAKKYNFKVEAE